MRSCQAPPPAPEVEEEVVWVQGQQVCVVLLPVLSKFAASRQLWAGAAAGAAAGGEVMVGRGWQTLKVGKSRVSCMAVLGKQQQEPHCRAGQARRNPNPDHPPRRRPGRNLGCAAAGAWRTRAPLRRRPPPGPPGATALSVPCSQKCRPRPAGCWEGKSCRVLVRHRQTRAHACRNRGCGRRQRHQCAAEL